MKKVLVFVPGYLPGFKNGGPVRTVANMIEALGDEIAFSVVCLDRDAGDKHAYPAIKINVWNQLGKAKVFYVRRGPLGAYKMLSILRNNKFDAIHFNNFLSFQFSILPLLIIKLFKISTYLILGPRGEFSEGALSLKSTKKKVFISICKLSQIYRDVTWHASSLHELEDIRRAIGQSANIRIATDIAASKSINEIPIRDILQPLKITLISRVSPMKNLEYAINLISSISESVIFDVFGPLEDLDYWKKCSQAAKRLPANIEFNYLGLLQPDDVIPTLAKYDLFFLPTMGENFGHIIAEALFAGLPVLISDQTPWRQLSEKRLGWDLPLSDKQGFASAIRQCTEYSSEDYYAWRVHIKDWALKNIGNQEAIDATRQLFVIK